MCRIRTKEHQNFQTSKKREKQIITFFIVFLNPDCGTPSSLPTGPRRRSLGATHMTVTPSCFRRPILLTRYTVIHDAAGPRRRSRRGPPTSRTCRDDRVARQDRASSFTTKKCNGQIPTRPSHESSHVSSTHGVSTTSHVAVPVLTSATAARSNTSHALIVSRP